MNQMKPASARMLGVLALKHKDPRYWTRERLAEHYGVSKVTITQATNKAKEFGVTFSLLSKAERVTEISSWGAFSEDWILAHFDELDELGKTKDKKFDNFSE